MVERSKIFLELGIDADASIIRNIRISKTSDGEYLVNGIKFADKETAKRYIHLFMLSIDGRVQNLMVCKTMKPMIKYPLKIESETVYYTPTFLYYEQGELVLEDVLTPEVADAKMTKIELMARQHAIDIKITR